MKKFLLVLSIIVAIFLIFCTAVVLLIQFPGFHNYVVNLISPAQVETTAETIIETTESINKKEIETTIVETTEPLPKLTTTLSNYNYKGCVSIEYPVIAGMDNKDMQEKINTKILNNAKSIVELYPISTSMQELNVKADVKEINDDKITILYEGRVVGYTVKDEAVSQSSSGTSRSNSLSDNPSNNYQISGFDEVYNVIPNLSGDINGEIPIIDTNQNSNGQAPGEVNNYQPVGPGYNSVVGFSRTVNVDQKIFYTNTINMKTAEDIYMSQFVKPETLAKYARSSKAEIVNVAENNEQEIRTYIRKSTVTALSDVFTKADFHNAKMDYWPKSFSYVEDDDLYFTVKLSSKLGNYALIKYSLNK